MKSPTQVTLEDFFKSMRGKSLQAVSDPIGHLEQLMAMQAENEKAPEGRAKMSVEPVSPGGQEC